MNLYILERTDHIDYDMYDSAIVAANNVEKALAIDIGSKFSWTTKENIKIKLLGKAVKGTKAGLILASFNAG